MFIIFSVNILFFILTVRKIFQSKQEVNKILSMDERAKKKGHQSHLDSKKDK